MEKMYMIRHSHNYGTDYAFFKTTAPYQELDEKKVARALNMDINEDDDETEIIRVPTIERIPLLTNVI